MTRALTVIKPEIIEAAKKGYVFKEGRWEGDEYETCATVMAYALRKQFVRTGIHTGEDWSWRGGKRHDYKYYKVYVIHPTDLDLYAWWNPSEESWVKPLNSDRLTWFELQPAKK